MQQDELSALFSRNLTLEQPAPLPVPVPVEAPQEEKKIVYISQHYNHSAHIARHDMQPSQPSQRPASEPPQPEHAAVENVLRNYHVDPSCLSSAQLQLFKTVDDPQRMKLIELWRVCPPTNSLDNPTLAWSMTSVSQEEILAKMRFEQRQRAAVDTPILSLDGTPLTPIQAGDGRWISAMSVSYMEPYMVTGYEEMARREYEESARRAYAEALQQSKDMYSHLDTATGAPTFNPAHSDPVYKTTSANVDWRQQQAMEDQYGRMMALRNDDHEML
ncbi:hypothetical protein B0H67DRAFT_478714 [Lasiosphaeris hirsuta]|uniref:Uncharacterized protein n=1 Tax=Lasiosphaeris hirsuta TaxID=260670 RepID=A0AA40EBC5_9PEZI|nr:hypothetical protein B0H67DRAFT_478714 [Lasiosphaeris hirsuta]